MKKVYYFLFLAVMALMSMNATADTPIKLDVDDAGRVTVKVNYVAVENIVNGVNELTVPQYGSVQIEAKEGFYLRRIYKTNKEGEAVEQSISNLTSCSIYLSDDDKNLTFTVKSGVLADARTASCTVKVDNAAKVKMERYESHTVVDLQNGDNTVKWIPDVEKTLAVGNANYGDAPIYKVTLDGAEVQGSGGLFFVTPKEGSVVVVTANYPDVDCPVKFNFSSDEVKGILSKVTADGKEVNNYTDAGFTVKAGTKLALTFDNTNYALDAFKVNDVVTNVYGTFEYLVKAATTFDIKAHKYATIKATLNVDKAENITVYHGNSYNNKVIAIKDGDNTIELNEANNMIQIKPNSGCKIETFKVDGNAMTAGYDGSYEVKLTEGMKIEITTSAIVRDQKAIVFIDDISLANYGFNFYRSDHSTVPMQSGENTLMFSADDNKFMFGAYGNDLSKMVAKLNGEALTPTYPGGTSFEVTLKDGDRLEILLSGPTGIDEVQQQLTNKKTVVYRLDGTRVEGENLPNGLYIINGKKIIIKKQ
ncbi:hypothetical protein [Prevotella falsenii]